MRAGPKAAPKGDPLPLYELPEGGSARVAAFIETYCRVVKGGKGNPAGELIRLRDWQRDFLADVYDPEPRPRQGLLSVARKNGKSLLGASIALYHLYADDEESAEVLLASSDQRTAEVIFKVARRMVELDDRLAGVTQIFQDRLYVPETDSVLEPLPANAKNLQGRNPSCSLIDEVHVSDADTWDALALAGGTRARPLTLGLSTECGDDPDNLMARLVEHGRFGEDRSFAFREYTAPIGCELSDRDAWAAANPMLGDTLDPDHLATVLGTTREAAFRRYHLNQRVSAAGSWLPAGVWDGLSTGRPIPAGAEVVISCDGSYNSDGTGLVVATVSKRPHFDVLNYWEPPERADDWSVPLHDVMDEIRRACRKYRVTEVVFDPFRYALVMQSLEAERVPVVAFPWSPARITPATTELFRAAVSGELSHSGDPRLARHVANAVLREDAKGVRLDKAKRGSKARIDLAAAMLQAHSRATWCATKSRKRARSFAS
ncbi:terminase large subunit [Arthrobacter sp. SLBN-53]|uniref:terminase large subunit domain-containing protein n=1 Tax=Arthrobacter sp. SLBN-53 TaxID=2768412 RepID=UPI001152C0B2|nr:terminase large subunit [Arthrobacter sp. SLBN-53]TQK27888.1 phage terminase large subunit-like protein [Arthrobacter sp. SLBN-53]